MRRIVVVIALMLMAIVPSGSASEEGPTVDDLIIYTGLYSLGHDHDIVVSVRNAQNRYALIFSDIRTGAIRMMIPRGQDSFVVGPELVRPEPVEATLSFVRDASGAVTTVKMRAAGEKDEMTAVRIPMRTEPVQFKGAGVRLEGTLYLPGEKPGPYPAAVFAHGSEDSDRYSFDALPMVLARHGIASLAYDKRGTGSSGGDWQSAGLEELARDLVEGLGVLIRRKEIDASRLGVIGFSEGGWTAPLASSMTPSIRFIVSLSGGAYTKGDSFMHKYRVRFHEEGLSGVPLEKALAEQQAIVDQSRRRVREEDSPTGFDRRISYDPTGHWKSFRGSILYIVGEYDALEPAASSAGRLGEILREAGHPDYTIKVLPRAHHGMFLGMDGSPSEFQTMRGISHLAPGYWDLLIRWLDVRLNEGLLASAGTGH